MLRREVESLRRATENLPKAYLKLKNEVQAWGGRVESTFVQLRANDAQNKETLAGVAEGLRQELGMALNAQRGELEASQRVLLGRVEFFAKGTHQEVVNLVGGGET